MVYRVSEVVKELGVSRQTVYKKLRREEYKKYIVDLNGLIGVTEDGLQKLKEVNSKEEYNLESEEYNLEDIGGDTITNTTDLQSKMLDELNQQLAVYKEQLKIKDTQIEQKDKQINDLIRVNENGQVLQRMILTNTELKLIAYREELEFRRNKNKETKGMFNKLKKFFK